MRLLFMGVVCAGIGCGSSAVETNAAPTAEAANELEVGRFVKVSNEGRALAPSAALGAGPGDWACTWDSRTGLLWEMKTLDGSAHDAQRTYSWFEPGGATHAGWRGSAGCGSTCDTRAFTADVNRQGLCGGNDWRLPRRSELEALVVCRTGRDASDDAWVRGFPCADYRTNTEPRVDSAFFPNIVTSAVNSGAYFFWSVDTYDVLPEYAFYVNFRTGGVDRVFKSEQRGVRLVRSTPRPAAPNVMTVGISWEGSASRTRTFSLSAARRVSLVSTGSFSAARWAYRTEGTTPLFDVACEPSADVSRCRFDIPAWAQPGRYELLLQARDEAGALVTTAPLLAELIP